MGGDGGIRRLLCTWQLLGLAVKWPWLALNGLRKRYSHLVGSAVYVMDYHSLVNE